MMSPGSCGLDLPMVSQAESIRGPREGGGGALTL